MSWYSRRPKILEVAARVFAEQGAAASTEQVAAEAGVAIGTIFRHFPTKADLLAAIMKDTLTGLAERMAAPDATLFGVFTALVAEAAAKRSVIDLLPGLEVGESIARFREVVAGLLAGAQERGEVRAEIEADEVMALLVAGLPGCVAGWVAARAAAAHPVDRLRRPAARSGHGSVVGGS